MVRYVYSQVVIEHGNHSSRDSNQILLNDTHQGVITRRELCTGDEVCYLRFLYFHE